MLWLCLKLPSCLFGNTRDTSAMHGKAKCVCFNYMQPQKVKIKSVQINMNMSRISKIQRSCLIIFEFAKKVAEHLMSLDARKPIFGCYKLTVKAATVLFISWRGLAISSVKLGISVW